MFFTYVILMIYTCDSLQIILVLVLYLCFTRLNCVDYLCCILLTFILLVYFLLTFLVTTLLAFDENFYLCGYIWYTSSYLRLTTKTTCVCKVRWCSLLMLLCTYVGCVFHLCFSTNCTCVITVDSLLTFNSDDYLCL